MYIYIYIYMCIYIYIYIYIYMYVDLLNIVGHPVALLLSVSAKKHSSSPLIGWQQKQWCSKRANRTTLRKQPRPYSRFLWVGWVALLVWRYLSNTASSALCKAYLKSQWTSWFAILFANFEERNVLEFRIGPCFIYVLRQLEFRIRPRLCSALFGVSRIAVICYSVRHFWRAHVLHK